MAIKGNISVPQGVITGAFNIRVSLTEDVFDFEMSNIGIANVSGAALGGHSSDRFGGHDRSYYLLCYPPDASKGESRISLTGSVTTLDGVSDTMEATERIVVYDTVKTVQFVFAVTSWSGFQVTIPISFYEAITGLTKSHFSFDVPVGTWHLYGSGQFYELVFQNPPNRFMVMTTAKPIRKANGITATIIQNSLEFIR